MIDPRLLPEHASHYRARIERAETALGDRGAVLDEVRAWCQAATRADEPDRWQQLESRLRPVAPAAAAAVAALASDESNDDVDAMAALIAYGIGAATREGPPTLAALSEALERCAHGAFQAFEDGFAAGTVATAAWVQALAAPRPSVDELFRLHTRPGLRDADSAFVQDQAAARDAVRHPYVIWSDRNANFVPYRDEPLRHLSFLRRLDVAAWLRTIDELPTIGLAADALQDWRFASDPDAILAALAAAPDFGTALTDNRVSIASALVLQTAFGFGARLRNAEATRGRVALTRELADASARAVAALDANELPRWAARVVEGTLARPDGVSLLVEYATFVCDDELRSGARRASGEYGTAIRTSLAAGLRPHGVTVAGMRARALGAPAPAASYLLGALLTSAEARADAAWLAWLGDVLVENDGVLGLLTGGREASGIPEFALELLAPIAPIDAAGFGTIWASLAFQRRARGHLAYRTTVGATTPSRILIWLSLIRIDNEAQRLAAEGVGVDAQDWNMLRSLWVCAFDGARTLRLVDAWGLDGDAALDVVRCGHVAVAVRPGFSSDEALDDWLRGHLGLTLGDPEVLAGIIATLSNQGFSTARVTSIFPGASATDLRALLQRASEWLRVAGRELDPASFAGFLQGIEHAGEEAPGPPAT